MQVYPLRDALHPSALFFIEKCDALGHPLNSAEIKAINFLVTKLIQTNLWNKFRAIYPFVGRVSKTHSLNLRNFYRHKINWFGSIGHNSLGIHGDGNGYGNTYFAPSWLSDTNIHVAVYTGTYWEFANENCPLIGASTSSIGTPGRGSGWIHAIYLRSPTPTFFSGSIYDIPPVYTYSCSPAINIYSTFAGEDASDRNHWLAHGLIVGTNGRTCYVCGKKFGIDTSLGGYPVPINPESGNDPIEGKKVLYTQFPFLILGNGRFGSGGQAKGRANLRFASIGYYMNEEENKIFYDIVNEFQTILKRNVPCNEISPYSANIKEKVTIHPSLQITDSDQSLGRYIRPMKDFIKLIPQKHIRYRRDALVPSIEIKSCTRIGPRRVFLADGAMPSLEILDLIEN